MPRLTKDERRARDAHLEWREWGKQFGWRLFGATYERSADFFIGDHEVFHVTALARAGIDRAIAKAREA